MPGQFIDDAEPEFIDDEEGGSSPNSMDAGAGRSLPPMTSEQQLLERMGFKYPEVQSSKLYRPGAIENTAQRGGQNALLGGIENTQNHWLAPLGGLVRGAASGGRAVEQGGEYLLNKLGLSSDADYQHQKAMMAAKDMAASQRPQMNAPIIGDPAEFVGSALPTLAFGVPGSAAKAALQGGMLAATAPVENRSENDFLRQKGTQTTVGAGLGAGTHGVLKYGVQPGLESLGRALPNSSVANPLRKLLGKPEVAPKGTASGDIRNYPDSLLKSRPKGLDVADTVKTDLERTMAADKFIDQSNFALRDKLADETGAVIKPAEGLAAIDRAIKRLTDPNVASKLPNPKREALIKKLTEFKANLATTSQKQVGKLVDDTGKPITKAVDTPNKFKVIANTITDLNNDISDTFKGNSEIGTIGSTVYQDIKTSLRNDMNKSAEASGNKALIEAHQKAQKHYSEVTAPRWKGNTPLTAVTQSATPDKIVNRMANMSADEAAIYRGAMGQSGQDAVKSSILEGIVNAPDPAKAMKAKSKAIEVFFQGEDAQKLQGIVNILSTADTAGQTAGLMVGAKVGGMLGHPYAGALVGARPEANIKGTSVSGMFGDWVKKYLQTESGQRLLLEAGQYPAGSPQLAKVLGKLQNVFVAESGRRKDDKLKTLLGAE